MNEHKFTPGLWTLGDENNQSCDINCGETIISLSRYPLHGDGLVISRDEMLANARLVIAAPDLLETLENLLTQFKLVSPLYSRDRELIREAEAAIDKATLIK